jgi:hypothetical protein
VRRLRRLFAPDPPAEGADKVAQWRWVREVQLRQLYVVVPLFVLVVILGLPPLLLGAAALGVLAGVANAVWLTMKIRRAGQTG